MKAASRQHPVLTRLERDRMHSLAVLLVLRKGGLALPLALLMVLLERAGYLQ